MYREEKIKIIEEFYKLHQAQINKVLGQNFLIDEDVVKNIVAAAELKKDDTVLEVGPGLGFLTDEIIKKTEKVIAVEKDEKLSTHLSKKYQDNKNIKILNRDILKLNVAKTGLEKLNYKVVANLPFYLTSRFMRIFLEQDVKPSTMVLLMQKEVAERIVASEPNHSLLSLSVKFYADAEIICEVSRESFHPAPDVDCAVIKISVLPETRVDVSDVKKFFQIIKVGFAGKRKQLHNNLASGFKISKDEAKKNMEKADVDPELRAQNLSLRDWQRLYEIF